MAASKSIEDQIKIFRKKLNTVASSKKKQATVLKEKAADAALHWVMSHDSRIKSFKSAVAGTPVAGAFDKLLDLLKAEATPPKKAATPKPAAKKAPVKKAAAKKAAPKKVAAKKAAKKATKKAAKKAAPPAA